MSDFLHAMNSIYSAIKYKYAQQRENYIIQMEISTINLPFFPMTIAPISEYECEFGCLSANFKFYCIVYIFNAPIPVKSVIPPNQPVKENTFGKVNHAFPIQNLTEVTKA